MDGHQAQVFRLRRGILIQGALYSLFFAAAVSLYSALPFLDDPQEHGFPNKQLAYGMAAFGVVVFGSMLVGSLWMIAAYRLARISLAGDVLELRSVFGSRALLASQIDRVVWKHRPMGGRIVLESDERKSNIDRDSYSRADRLEIIGLIHSRVPANRHFGWPIFCHRIALPLREHQQRHNTLPLKAREGEVVLRRTRYDRPFTIALVCNVAIAAIVWLVFDLHHLAPMPFFLIATWLLLRYSVPAQGDVRPRVKVEWETGTWLPTVAGIVLAMLLMSGGGLAGYPDEGCTGAVVIMTTLLVWVVVRTYRQEKRQEAQHAIAAESAPAKWDAIVSR